MNLAATRGESFPAKSPLYNSDLAPVPPERRTWTMWNIAALWIGMAICITTYTLASGLIEQGMNWWQATLTVFLGNVIVLIPMTLNAHPGTAFGIPFPVLLRSSFGTLGANIPALMRAFVACGWFGIQTWVGGAAMYATGAVIFGFDPATKVNLPLLGIPMGELICFLLFWLLNIAIIWRGMESIKWLEVWSAPLLIATGIGLLCWALKAANGWGPILSQPSKFKNNAEFWPVFAGGLTAMVGYWATLSLNIPDFSRFAKSQRAQVLGQALGLPLAMTFYSFLGIAVTSATMVIFGEAIWDPVKLMTKFNSPALSVMALVTFAVATLSTNIAANVVSPANDFSNLSPRRISFRTGSLITGFIGILMAPWKLYQDPRGYIFTWLIGYSALLGPVAGIMIADYFVHRRRTLDVSALFDPAGEYRFTHGFSLVGIAALIFAVLPNIPGFLVAVHLLSANKVSGLLLSIYSYAWFAGFALAFLLYLGLRRIWPAG